MELNKIESRFTNQLKTNLIESLLKIIIISKYILEDGKIMEIKSNDFRSIKPNIKEIEEKAIEIAINLKNINKENYLNKLKGLESRVGNSYSKEEAFYHLAVYFPKFKKSKDVINSMVEILNKWDFLSFKKFLRLITIYSNAINLGMDMRGVINER
ncbi:MAG: hypothetical protein ACTSVV_09835 [Promethearchaeota archaeon]